MILERLLNAEDAVTWINQTGVVLGSIIMRVIAYATTREFDNIRSCVRNCATLILYKRCRLEQDE